MKRVVVDHFGGPEVLRVVEEDDPRPGPGEVRVKVLAAGVSYTDAMLRAGSYLGVPNPPFTPGYELVGVVEELGPGCTRLRVGDRVGALTVWGADAERVCVPEAGAVEVPEDLDPAEVLSLVFIYMTAYQLLHRTAKVKRGRGGARARRGREGGHRRARAGTRCRASPVRHVLGPRPCRGGAARRGGDRLPQRRLRGAGARAAGQGRGRRARRPRRHAVAALLPRAAARRKARRVRALRHGRARTQELAGLGRVVRDHRAGRTVGPVSIRAGEFPPTGSRGSAATATRRSRWAGNRDRFQSAASRATRSGSGRTSAPCSNCCAAAISTRSWRSACR